MSFQVFTRKMTYKSVGKPRRVQVFDTVDAARDYCTGQNARLSARQMREGFRYEFANLDWYTEAFL